MEILKKLFGKKEVTTPIVPEVLVEPPVPKVVKPKVKRKPKVVAPVKTAKDIATEAGEPWVSILSIDIDPDNLGNGAFELDWNDTFLAKLMRAGYVGKTDQMIVDQWFQEVCRNVILENFEQYEANNPRGGSRKDIGNGRTEIS